MTHPPTTLKTVEALVEAGLIEIDGSVRAQREHLDTLARTYAIALSPTIASLAAQEKGMGPISRQFVPDARELHHHPDELVDPIGDDIKSPVAGIVHRYTDRALLKLVSVCPVYCRFCFRRETVGPGKGNALGEAEFETALDYIKRHDEIWEVIVTGGDPLILSSRRLAHVTRALSQIPHIKIIRWHTRVPVVMPDHVSRELAHALSDTSKTVFVSLHSNHPSELCDAARAACARLIDAGIGMVSQTVLLRGINDDVDVLEALMRAFVELQVKPYYLHHPDLAPGTSHFRLPIVEGQQIFRQLCARLSGLARPTYVLDIPGAHGKVPVSEPHVTATAEAGVYQVTDTSGTTHIYRDSC